MMMMMMVVVVIVMTKVQTATLLTVGITVMKNWLPFVLAPAFAMLKVYGRSCLRFGWNSSSNSPPQMLSPPVPVPV
jgi:hypothetical protein